MIRAWALPWLVAALALRLFLAPGLMPEAGADGPTITICSGVTDHGHAPPGAPVRPCPYAALGTPVLAAVPPVPALPPRTASPVASVAIAVERRSPARHAPVPPARAPPGAGSPTLLTA